jgi:predicted nucleic acid-binding protein
MIVVADTTPLNYLIQIGAAWILRDLYGQVLIPSAVLDELRAMGAPSEVGVWAKDLPTWVRVLPVAPLATLETSLGAGESEAIQLAILLHADLILIDDGPARRAAKARGLVVTGTLGVLKEAADESLLGFHESVMRIRQLGFRMTDGLLEQILGEEQDSTSGN